MFFVIVYLGDTWTFTEDSGHIYQFYYFTNSTTMARIRFTCTSLEPSPSLSSADPANAELLHLFHEFRNLLIFSHLTCGRAFQSVISQPMELIYCNRPEFLPRHRVTRLVRPRCEACPPWQHAHLSSLPTYRVVKLLKTFPTPPNPSTTTTKSKIAVTRSARPGPHSPVRLDIVAAKCIVRAMNGYLCLGPDSGRKPDSRASSHT